MLVLSVLVLYVMSCHVTSCHDARNLNVSILILLRDMNRKEGKGQGQKD